MKPDPFDELARLIETTDEAFPVAQARRLILRATSRATVTPELAKAIDLLNTSILLLDVVIEFDGYPRYAREEAAGDLENLRSLCLRLMQ